MAGLNKVQLIGHLGIDPEVKTLESNTKVANFRMATTEVYKNRNGERVEKTEWHNIVLWRGLAEISEKYLHKGSKVYVEGKIRNRSWEDQEGQKKYITEIQADSMIMLDSAGSGNTGGGNTSNASSNTNTPVNKPSAPRQNSEEYNESELEETDNSDDLPF